jgi:hypothetical protein
MARKQAEDIAKLPQWAQNLIKQQEQEIAGLRRDMGVVLGDGDEEDPLSFFTIHLGHIPNERIIHLPRYTDIEFHIGKAQNLDGYAGRRVLRLMERNGRLDITGEYGEFVVIPRATNNLHLDVINDRYGDREIAKEKLRADN